MDPVRRGQREAWKVFGIALAVYVAVGIVIRVAVTDPYCGAQRTCGGLAFARMTYLAMASVAIGLVVLIAAMGVSSQLPPDGEKAFWRTGLVCMALSGLLWFSICAGGMIEWGSADLYGW